jgi:hypothetical protein
MLHCNMTTSNPSLQTGLEDLLGDLKFARRSDDLGRLALLAYCEVRRWARVAGEPALAQHSMDLFNQHPHTNRETFITEVDALIAELTQAGQRVSGNNPLSQ